MSEEEGERKKRDGLKALNDLNSDVYIRVTDLKIRSTFAPAFSGAFRELKRSRG